MKKKISIFILFFSLSAKADQNELMWQKLGEASYQYFKVEQFFNEVNERIIPKEWQKYGGIVWIAKSVLEQRVNYEIGW